MNIFGVFMVIYVCLSAFGQTIDNDEMCFPIRRSSSTAQAQVQLRQGRPRKLDHLAQWVPMVPKEYVVSLEFVNVMKMKLNG